MNNIKISAYFITYNSEKILPHLLKYYKTFCSKITIIDNCSTDSTEQICKQYEVSFLRFNTNETFNDLANISIKNEIWKKDIEEFDYIIVGDNDEFLNHPDGIINFLSDKSNLGYTIFKPIGYHMIGDLDLTLNADDNIFKTINKGYPVSSMNKPILFNCKKVYNMNYCVGCHNCNPEGNIKIYENDNSFKLLHYKFLGLNYHLDRCNSLAKRLSQFNKSNNLGTYYLENEEYHKRDYMHFYNNRQIIL